MSFPSTFFGWVAFLLEKYGMTAADIVQAVRELY